MNKSRFFILNSGVAALLFSVATACGGDGADDGTGGTGTGGTGTGGTATGGMGGSGTGGSATGGSATGGFGGAVGGAGGVGGEGGYASQDPVDLGAAADFVILAKSAISTVPLSSITGDVGLSPAAASYITGFSLIEDASGEFATSLQVTGNIFSADDADPTPADLTAAVSAMEAAFIEAVGRAPDATEVGAGDIGGMTIEAGVYKWGTGVLLPDDVTLSGDEDDVWIFQIAEDLTVDSATSVFLTGGALPENVFWQVSGKVEVGTTAHVQGIVLSQTSIALATGASVSGRLFAQTAVTLDGNVVVEPEE